MNDFSTFHFGSDKSLKVFFDKQFKSKLHFQSLIDFDKENHENAHDFLKEIMTGKYEIVFLKLQENLA